MQKKAEISYFTIQKFFVPALVFYPTFVTSKVEHIWVVNMKSEQTSRLKKWGKKLVRGVKNFWFGKYGISAFVCTKNYQKIFKTREYSWKWNLIILKVKNWKIEKFEKFENFPKISDFLLDFVQTSRGSIFASFWDFSLIFGANESWDHPPKNEKVFYPPH